MSYLYFVAIKPNKLTKCNGLCFFSEIMAKDKRKTNLYNFEEADVFNFKELFDNDSGNIDMAFELFNHKQSINTSTGYAAIVKKFKMFCETKPEYDFFNFGEKEVANFVTHLAKTMPTSKFVFNSLKPALSRLETMRGVKEHRSAFTPRIDHILVGAKRRARELAPEPCKMDILPKEALERALRTYVWPYLHEHMSIDLHAFRVIFRWLLYTKTCCRWDCINHLQAKHFMLIEVDSNDGLKEKAISVKFPKSKNNQYKDENIRMLDRKEGSVFDPLPIVALYFKRCGYSMDGKDTGYINCMIRKQGGTHMPIPDRRLSYATGMAQAKGLLEKMGFSSKKYGETSAKRAAVSYAIEGGTAIDVVQQVGAWKTQHMPLVYANNSAKHKVNLVKQMKYE